MEISKFIIMHSGFLQLLHEDGRKCIKEAIHIFVALFPDLPQTVTEWMYIVGVWGYWKTQWMLFWASYGTAHLAYKYWTNCTVLIYCTYSNYTEAALTCSAGQQERNCQADIFWSEVQTLLWNYIVTHIQR